MNDGFSAPGAGKFWQEDRCANRTFPVVGYDRYTGVSKPGFTDFYIDDCWLGSKFAVICGPGYCYFSGITHFHERLLSGYDYDILLQSRYPL